MGIELWENVMKASCVHLYVEGMASITIHNPKVNSMKSVQE